MFQKDFHKVPRHSIIRGERGLALLGLVISLVIVIIICVVAWKSFNMSGKNKAAGEDPKAKAVGAHCRMAVSSLARGIDMYRSQHNEYPFTLDKLLENEPSLKSYATSGALWTSGGAPDLKTTSDSFLIYGFCNDGNRYLYDSQVGSVAVEPYPKQ